MQFRSMVKYTLALIVAAVVGVACYAPGLDGPFVFDDAANILNNPSVQMEVLNAGNLADAALSWHGSGYLNRPIPRVSFALDFYFSGRKFDSRAFKVTNLAVHLLNGLLVFLLSLLLMRCLRGANANNGAANDRERVWFWMPVVVSVVWLLHPIQLTSTLYIVQRMTSMAAMAVLIGLIVFVVGRRRHQESRRFGLTLMALGIAGGTTFGVLCKENAVLMPLFALLIELFFFDRATLRARARLQLKLFYGGLFGLMGLSALSLVATSPDLLTRDYAQKNFTLVERLLTQPRVLFYYLGLLVFPNLREFSLYHDDVVTSTGLLTPVTTLIALSALVIIIAVAIRGIKNRSMLSFGLLWFLVGHGIESGIVGLELIHEHRNYLPSVGIVFAAVFHLFRLLDRGAAPTPAIMVAGLAFVAVLAFVTHARASVWSSPDGLTFFMVRNHPGSYRAQMERGYVLERSGVDVKLTYAAYRKAAAANPFRLPPLMSMQRIVYGLIRHLQERSLPERDRGEGPERVDLLRDDLAFDLAYLRKLDASIASEFTHRLTSYAMNAEAIVALRELQRCSVQQVDSCPPASRVDAWLEAALNHKGIQPIQKAALLLTKARIYANRGYVAEAVGFVEEAFERSEGEVGFLIELAGLFRALQDFDNAERILARIEPIVQQTGRRGADFRRLEKFIAREREQYEGAGSGSRRVSNDE